MNLTDSNQIYGPISRIHTLNESELVYLYDLHFTKIVAITDFIIKLFSIPKIKST